MFIGGEIGGIGGLEPLHFEKWEGGGLSPLIFQMYILFKKASEALSGGQKFQIFLGPGEHAPQTP